MIVYVEYYFILIQCGLIIFRSHLFLLPHNLVFGGQTLLRAKRMKFLRSDVNIKEQSERLETLAVVVPPQQDREAV
jgi:hypothetical protein